MARGNLQHCRRGKAAVSNKLPGGWPAGGFEAMRIQFLVQTLASAHQSLALVHCCNELVSKGHEVQVFVEDKGSPPIKPDFPIFDASYAYTQNNPLIVTSLSSLAVAINSPVSRKIWFYAGA
jgi:hypothetical protein